MFGGVLSSILATFPRRARQFAIPETMRVIASQVNGEIFVCGTNSDVDASQANGKIEVDASLPLNGVMDLSTANGAITLYVPSDTSADLSCISGTGTVTTNLAVDVTNQTKNTLIGTLGLGDGAIRISTATGEIRLWGI